MSEAGDRDEAGPDAGADATAGRPADACVAFAAGRRVAAGSRQQVALELRRLLGRDPRAVVLVFDADSSLPVPLDLSGSLAEVAARYAARPAPPQRRRLVAVGHQVDLLPRHWDWLSRQPGGASATLRRLVEAARRSSAERQREAREATYRFMNAVAGDHEGYEEALRALYADRREDFERHVESWPPDLRRHARELAARAFDAG